MIEMLSKIWYTYIDNTFYRRESELSKKLGWQLKKAEHRTGYSGSNELIYKDHLMIKNSHVPSYRNSSSDAFCIYLAEDINDPDPILIYYCYEHNNNIGSFREGWVNIGDWSLIAKKMIDEDMNIIKEYNEQETFKEYIEKEKQFTNLIKPNLHEFFKQHIDSLDRDVYLKLCNEIMSETKLNDYTREQDQLNAIAVMDKLKG